MRARLRKAVAEEILAAAERALAEQGVHGASIGDIAARAGVSVGTVYNHFADRKALVQALYRSRRQTLGPKLALVLESHRGAPLEKALRGFVGDVLALFDEHRDFVKVALHSEHLRPAETEGEGSRPVLIRLHDGFREILRERVDAEKLDLAARHAAAGLRAAVLHGLAQDTPFAADAEALAELILHGVARRR